MSRPSTKVLDRPRTLDLEEIKAIIPQRFPFLMVDRVIEVVPGVRVTGIKLLTGNEWFYQGHFPEKAVTPGAMILEAMAQTAIVFLRFCADEPRPDVTYLLGSAKVRYLQPVLPGSSLRVEVTPLRLTGRAAIVHGVASVDGSVVARAELGLGMKGKDDTW